MYLDAYSYGVVADFHRASRRLLLVVVMLMNDISYG